MIVTCWAYYNNYSHFKILCHGDNYCINFRIPLCYYSFATSLSAYLESCQENNDLVAVHCTHGLNRTGYLVCR